MSLWQSGRKTTQAETNESQTLTKQRLFHRGQFVITNTENAKGCAQELASKAAARSRVAFLVGEYFQPRRCHATDGSLKDRARIREQHDAS
jgi:hypothetical protein